MGARTVKVPSVYVTDPESLTTKLYVAGDTIPDGVEVGAHVFREAPDYTGTPQTGPTISAAPIVAEAPASEPSAAPDSDGEPDLSGTVDEVLVRVGDDPAAAARYLAAESEQESPRKTLLAALEKTAGGSE